MVFLTKLVGVAGLLLGMTVLAGEDPQTGEQKASEKSIGSKKVSVPRNVYKRELKLYPRNRIEEIEEALKKIPADAITQFLTSPRVVEENEIDTSPYVLEFVGEHVIGGAGARIYVRSILEPATLEYSIYRKGDPYYSPNSKKLLGYAALYLGDAKLQREGDPATLMITKSNQEIRRGDRLMEVPEEKSTVNFFPELPKVNITGNILSVLNGVSQIGKYNIVVIDKGIADDMKVGHILDIYQRGRMVADRIDNNGNSMVQLPDEIAGTLMIFRAFKRVSYALVLKATDVIHILDKVKTPEYARFE
jgi:hypothetical protein